MYIALSHFIQSKRLRYLLQVSFMHTLPFLYLIKVPFTPCNFEKPVNSMKLQEKRKTEKKAYKKAYSQEFRYHKKPIKSHFQLRKKLFYLLQWKSFKNDGKRFLFQLRSSFCSQDIYFFVEFLTM